VQPFSSEGIQFLSKVNNRTSPIPEIILDSDKDVSEYHLNHVCDNLERYGVGEAGKDLEVFVYLKLPDPARRPRHSHS